MKPSSTPAARNAPTAPALKTLRDHESPQRSTSPTMVSSTTRLLGNDTGDSTLVGHVLGGSYRIEEEIGRGEVGTVFRAMHAQLGRPVAVKVVTPHLAADRGTVERFAREAKVLGQLSHPNIVQVHDLSTNGFGQPYLVMDLLHGAPLDEILHAGGALSPRTAVALARQAASALRAAHLVGIVHCNLEPKSLFVLDAGAQPHVKLLDFGLGKQCHDRSPPRQTGDFAIPATSAYMPPELAAGSAVDHRGNQYSLAAILHEMLTGRAPRGVRENTERSPSSRQAGNLPPAIDSVILRALDKDPAARWETIDEFSAALEAACPRESVDVRSSRYSLTPGEEHWDHFEAKQDSPRTSARSLEAQLGPFHTTRLARTTLGPTPGRISADLAFILSRIEGDVTIDDVIDLCPFAPTTTVRHLFVASQMGLIVAMPGTRDRAD